MRFRFVLQTALLTALLAASALISSCTPIETKQPVLKAHMAHNLRAEMSLMAHQLATISNLSLDSSRSEHSKSAEIIASLDRIKSIASDLGGDDVVTNYSVINRYMGAFLYDVQLAREFALRDSPNNYPAYTLVKSCLSCHQSL